VLLEKVDKVPRQHHPRRRLGRALAFQALIEDHRHRKIGVDARKGARIQRAPRRPHHPEPQHHAGIEQCAGGIAADDRVHGKPGKQRVGEQQCIFQRHQRQGREQLAGVGPGNGLEGLAGGLLTELFAFFEHNPRGYGRHGPPVERIMGG